MRPPMNWSSARRSGLTGGCGSGAIRTAAAAGSTIEESPHARAHGRPHHNLGREGHDDLAAVVGGLTEGIDGSAVVGPHTTDPDLDVTIWLPAEAWLRLLTERLYGGHQPATVVIESDGVTLEDLRRVSPGF